MRTERQRATRREARRTRFLASCRGSKPPLDWLVSLYWESGYKSYQLARSYEDAHRLARWYLETDERLTHAWVRELSVPRPEKKGEKKEEKKDLPAR